ncbi:hypothetical protein FSARC_6373 [Fusarium sarcochroum]|uniref:Peptidase S8/S53 domain-containing protein n=1 Tax=Fusarium sarcochroum TaxID=1208366 RepID=A0A8H4X8F4_9HYPO|nr:hypothetical protein FSARC_6373 [Fusarium sarcochroum]
MSKITVNGNTINTEELPKDLPQTATKTNFILVQGNDRDFNVAQKLELAELGVDIQEYVAQFTYLCRYEHTDLQPIRNKSYVKNVTIYLRELKSTVSLKDMVEREDHRTFYRVDCILHETPNVTSEALAGDIAEKAGLDIKQLQISPARVRLTVHQDKLQALAKLDSISRIEEVRPDELLNDLARGTLMADILALSTPYEGAGQKICVADTGFDQGKIQDELGIQVHPAFKGRIERLDSLWLKDDYKDTQGHGTHVCASICGNGLYKPGNIRMRGTAPAATLMVQSIATISKDPNKGAIEVPIDLGRDLFTKAYDLGFRIHSNSWSKKWDENTGQLGYEGQAWDIDKFVNDHQDFVVLVAAGNNADRTKKKSHIGAAGSAFNSITVGATGSTRPNDSSRFDGEPGAKPVTRINDTAVFSSRGPTLPGRDANGKELAGRIKPDVVAPGVAILSAASRALAKNSRERGKFGRSADEDWTYMSGTSMSTPLVAGCVALLREALQEHGKQRPSAALIKALLVNGAVNYSERLGLGLGYDYEQGFGRVDIDSSISMVKLSSFIDGGNDFEATDFDVPALRQTPEPEKRWSSAQIPVPSGRNRLTVSLAYPDKAAQSGLMQNDVNLIVLSGGTERHGNMGKASGFDHTNNVEKVIWENVPGDTFKIVVSIFNNVDVKAATSFAVAWDIRPLARL